MQCVICPPPPLDWDRVNISENLGKAAALPALPLITPLVHVTADFLCNIVVVPVVEILVKAFQIEKNNIFFLLSKCSWWKNSLIIILSIQQNWNFPPRTDSQILFWFLWGRTMISHWKTLVQLTPAPVTQKLRRTVLKKANTEWQEKKIQICCMVRTYTQAFLPPNHL